MFARIGRKARNCITSAMAESGFPQYPFLVHSQDPVYHDGFDGMSRTQNWLEESPNERRSTPQGASFPISTASPISRLVTNEARKQISVCRSLHPCIASPTFPWCRRLPYSSK